MDNGLQLSHDQLASFTIPRSVLVAAQDLGQEECMQIVDHSYMCKIVLSNSCSCFIPPIWIRNIFIKITS